MLKVSSKTVGVSIRDDSTVQIYSRAAIRPFSHRKAFDATTRLRYFTAMFGLSLGHLIILAFVVLLFGSRRLPELGHALGKGISAFKRGLEGKGADDKDDPKLPPGA